MSFSAAFQMGGSILGAIGSRGAAKYQQKMAAYQADVAEAARRDSAQNAAFMGQMGGYTLGLQEDQNDYFKDIYNSQNKAEQDLQAYLRAQDRRNEGRLLQDRDDTFSRQRMMDSAARERRQFELDRIARNDNLAQEEREFAIAELQAERERARTERNQELDRMGENRETLNEEFAGRLSRLQEDKRIRAAERREEIDRQNRVIGESSATRDRLRGVLDQFGNISTPELIGEDEFRRRSDVLYDSYKGEVDSLADRAMSTTEANLIRSGMDMGGSANAQRAEVIARLAPEYAKAKARANADAATGVETANKIRKDRFENLHASLSKQMDAEQQAGMTGLDLEARLNPQTSAVLDRDVGSAFNAYLQNPRTSTVGVRGPMSIGSGIYSAGQVSDPYAQQLRNPGFSYDANSASGYASGPQLNSYNPDNFFSNQATAMGTNYTNASNAANTQFDRAATASEQYGNALSTLGKEGGAFLDQRFPNFFSKPGGGGGAFDVAAFEKDGGYAAPDFGGTPYSPFS